MATLNLTYTQLQYFGLSEVQKKYMITHLTPASCLLSKRISAVRLLPTAIKGQTDAAVCGSSS